MKIASPQLPLIPCFLKIKMQSRELCHMITKYVSNSTYVDEIENVENNCSDV